MELLFGHAKTPKGSPFIALTFAKLLEIIRDHQRTIRKSMRDVERERVALQNQEKKITLEIKRMAKQGQLVRSWAFTSPIDFTGSRTHHGEGPCADT